MPRTLIWTWASALAAVILATAAPAAAEDGRHVAATAGGASVEYADRGTGPVIVVVASLGRGAGDFDDLAGRLAAGGIRVIAPEPRGIGHSTGPAGDATLHDYAADIAAVIERERVAPVVVLGHAYGNTVARTLATDRPDLVRGVVLVAASGRAPLSPEIRRAIARASDLTVPDAERLRDLSLGYFAPGNDPSPWLGGWHPAVQVTQWGAFNRSKPSDYIAAGGHVPILDVQGEDDVIIPRQYSLDLQKELGERVRVVVIPHAGHALLPEQPAAAAAAIRTWMHDTFGQP